ncbi:Coiled-coil domain-containing protein 39 [Plasmodiophora brassicae]|uniref:Uncharacterized protein n=1 Tax=Plasmodiophora brassicae TaxID=37360 RepID=A0A3P3Y4K6_PLABS|nr:unnamed protein product [Plasmodiophora brassicae]
MADGVLDKDKSWDAVGHPPGVIGDAARPGPAVQLTDDEVADEARLLEHNRRFQVAVLDQLDTQLQALHEQIGVRDDALKWTERSRTDLALALRQAKSQIIDLKRSVHSTQQQLESSMSETKQLRWRLVEVTGEASSLRDSNQSSKVEIAALHDKVDTQVNENAKMRQLQNVVADDLRMHHLFQQSLQSEIGRLQEEKRVILRNLNQWQNKFERAVVAVRDVSCEAVAQKHETKLAQTALSAVVKELDLLCRSNDLLLFRWEQSVDAMDERDGILRRTAADAANAKKQLHVLEVISKRAEEDNVALQAKYNALEHRQFRLSKTHDETISNLKDSREAEMRTQKALERSGLAYYQILGALKKSEMQAKALEDRIEHLSDELMQEKAVVLSLKNDAKASTEAIAKTEELLNRRLAEAQAVIQQQAVDNARLVTLIGSLQAKSDQMAAQLKVEMKQLRAANETLMGQCEHADRQWKRALEHSSHIQSELATMEARAHRAEHQLADVARIPVEAEKKWQQATIDLQTTLASVTSELEQMRVAFAESQKALVKARQRCDQWEQERDRAVAELQMANARVRRAETNQRRQESRDNEILTEISEVRAEHRLQSQRMQATATKSLAKDRALVESEFSRRADIADAKSGLLALKQQLVVARTSKSDVARELADALHGRIRTETALRSAQEQLDTVKGDLQKQIALNADLKRQIQATQKDRLINDKRFEGWASRVEAMKARGQLDVTLPSVTTAASPARSARGRRRSTAQHDTAALDSLKLESQILRQMRTDLNWTRTDLQTKVMEIARRQQHTEALTAKNAEAREQIRTLETKVDLLEQKNASLKRNVVVLGNRCIRAESMAAAFEAKIKDLRPDYVIDYAYRAREPSARLSEVIAKEVADDLKGKDADDPREASVAGSKPGAAIDDFLKKMEFPA